MPRPLVAIVGRPNVGKSTFFNRVAGKRIAIVEDTPGVTRDRIYYDVEWNRHSFTIVDTGGIDMNGEDVFLPQIKEQAQAAIDLADVIVLFVDGRDGVHPDDMDVAQLLRHTKKPIILAVNKMDNPAKFSEAWMFFELGMGEPYPISATLGLGIGELLDAIVSFLPENTIEDEKCDSIHIAVIGKPNVGKSSLVNRLIGENRMIVENVPGTTRDAIDTAFVRNGQKFVVIDTAGLRRKRSIEDNTVERYSVVRALDAVRRCDVVLIVIDASQGLTEQDSKVAGYAHEQGKPSVILINKWDLVEKDTYTIEKYKQKVTAELPFMDYAQTLFISALTGQRVNRVLDMVVNAYQQSKRRIQTGVLNETINQITATVEPPSDRGRRLKIYYVTQVDVTPPTFLIFVNDPNLLHFSYLRYLENQLRSAFGFEGTPIRLFPRQREK